jgi:hypothetical protein
MPNEPFERFRSGGALNPIVGPTIASTTSISPTYGIHPVSGTEVVKFINVPYADFKGQIVFLPTGAWTTSVTTGTSGNIAKAVTAVANVPVIAVYDGTSWYLKV